MAEYIERGLLLMDLDSHIDTMKNKFGHLGLLSSSIRLIQNTRDFIAVQPAADVAPVVHSHWVHDYSNVFKCFNCLGKECMPPRKLRPYCPNCGAKMDGE